MIIEEGEGEKVEAKVTKNILNEIRPENFPDPGEKMTIQEQETFRTPNRKDQKRTLQHYTTVKMLSMHNNIGILKAVRQKL
jgi:hypothetical protein